jgi:flagellar hook-associated protein 1 FlgK
MTNFESDKEQYNTYTAPSVIMKVQAQLDQMVHGMVTMINDVLCPNKELELADGTKIMVLDTEKAPIGDDADKTMGTELFTRKSTSRYTKVTVDTADGPMDVFKYNEEDTTDAYTMYTINEIQVNPALLKNSSLLPLNSNPSSGYVDGYTMDTAKALVNTFNIQFSSLDPNLLTKYTFSDYYTQMIGELGTQGQVWNSIVSNQTSLTKNVDNNRQEEMGVSTDEELVNLIKFQHSYSASSRYINVINEMLEHLLNKLG